MNDAIEAFGALAHGTRLSIFRALVVAGEPVSAGELASFLGVPSPTLSFHLKELKQAGVVSCERRGRSLMYSADFDTMRDLVRFVTQDCCGGLPKVRRAAGAA
ncbi:MAG: metalloregulator ArsR/SmtB family transcription factor [Myxococcota bacterium]